MINNLNKDIIWDRTRNDYFDLCKELNGFYENHWHRKNATLKSEYFSTPWRTASTVAAIILLMLTFIQTICSIIPLVQLQRLHNLDGCSLFNGIDLVCVKYTNYVFLCYYCQDKLQITHLKFRDIWILYPELSEFGFYLLKFGVFGFYTQRCKIWILLPKVWKYLDFTLINSETLGYKIQILLNFWE